MGVQVGDRSHPARLLRGGGVEGMGRCPHRDRCQQQELTAQPGAGSSQRRGQSEQALVGLGATAIPARRSERLASEWRARAAARL